MDSKEWWDIYRYQDRGPDPFIAPIVSDDESQMYTYKGENLPKWKEVLLKVSIILGIAVAIILSALIRRL